MKIIKKLYKKLLLVGIGVYVICIFVSQQQTLNRYKKEVKEYENNQISNSSRQSQEESK